MAKLGISTGTAPNDGTGDSLLQGAIKINSNFNEIYNTFGDGSSLKNNWSYNSVGIATTSNVGVGTTSATSSQFSVYGGVQFYHNKTNKTFETTSFGISVPGITSVSNITITSGLNAIGICTFTNSLYLKDSVPLYFGNAGDLQIVHDEVAVVDGITGCSVIQDSGTGKLVIASNGPGINISKGVGGENMARFFTDGAVELYYDNSKKFETIGYGATVYGILESQGLNISGVSTVKSILVSNDGTNNGSLLIEDSGPNSYLLFRASNGSNQGVIAGSEANILITPGSGGYVSLSGVTKNIFYENGNVILNNGNQGSTVASNGLQITGITSTTEFNVGVAGTVITANSNNGRVGIGSTQPTTKLDIVGGDVKIGINTSNGLILTSPNGTKYRLFVNNSGGLLTELVP